MSDGTTASDLPRLPNGVSGIRISGIGAEVPPNVVTTAEVEERAALHRFGFEPGWLERTTGVRERRFADRGVLPSELAVAAARRALEDAGVGPEGVDLVIFAGITKDCLEPATANLVAEAIGAREARVFDLANACNGVMDGVDVADSLIRTGKARRVLVVTGERASLAINWHPQTAEEALRAVAALVVGDGGGALLVEASDDPQRGLREREFRSDPTQWRHALGGRFNPLAEGNGGLFDPHFTCDGRDLLFAVLPLLPPVMGAVLARTGWTHHDLDIIFCHLPTRRFLGQSGGQPGISRKSFAKVWSTVERFGNASTTSLPLAMAEARDAGKLVPGAKVLVVAPASGVSAGALTMVW